MKIVIIHGQLHKGITYYITHTVIGYIDGEKEIKEFFLPKDGPGFCVGCNQCFLRGEEYCPEAARVQPIMKAMEEAELIVLDTPNYCMEMSGAMKTLLEHFAYRWMTHRPSKAMFSKVGLTVSSSAGAPAGHTTRALAKQLKWLGIPKRYCFPFISRSMQVTDLSDERKAKIDKKAKQLARRIQQSVVYPKVGLFTKLLFFTFRKMQSGEAAAWNPTDRQWWEDQGWLAGARPWK